MELQDKVRSLKLLVPNKDWNKSQNKTKYINLLLPSPPPAPPEPPIFAWLDSYFCCTCK